MTKNIRLDTLTPQPGNPRTITPDALERLKESIRRDPEYMEARPIIVDKGGVIRGGNQRHRACLDLGMEEVPATWVRRVNWDEEKLRRFVVVDNGPEGMSGEWDLELLAEDWEDLGLEELGFDPVALGLDEPDWDQGEPDPSGERPVSKFLVAAADWEIDDVKRAVADVIKQYKSAKVL